MDLGVPQGINNPSMCVLTGFYNSWLVAGADRQHLQHSACGPQKLLISIRPHYIY